MASRVLAVLAAAAFVAACGGGDAGGDAGTAVAAPRLGPVATLSVEGRTSATPWLAASGDLVAVAWGASNDDGAEVVVAVSRDGGRSFEAPVRVPGSEGARLGGEFPPRVAVTRVGGREELVVAWTADGLSRIVAARSTDGGRTFAAPSALQRADAPGRRGWPALAVDASGGGHVVWLDHRGLATGATHTHGTHGAGKDGVAMAAKSSLYYTSIDGNDSEQPIAPGVCYCCKTTLAAGPDGAIYAAWRHVYPGNLRDIAFAVLRGGGAPAEPVRISEDQWQLEGCPDDGPAMAADGSGVVHVVWPTVVTKPGPRGAIFLASTKDGRTFSPRIEVPTLGSVKPSHPQIAIADDGRIIVAWDEHLDGRRVAAAREVRLTGDGGASFSDAIDLSASPAAYYPVIAAVGDGFIAVWSDAETSTIGVRRFAP